MKHLLNHKFNNALIWSAASCTGMNLLSTNSYRQFQVHTSPWGPSQYKDLICQYRDSHYKDKTVSQPSYLNMMTLCSERRSLYCDGPLTCCCIFLYKAVTLYRYNFHMFLGHTNEELRLLIWTEIFYNLVNQLYFDSFIPIGPGSGDRQETWAANDCMKHSSHSHRQIHWFNAIVDKAKDVRLSKSV